MIEMRMRSKVGEAELKAKKGKIVTDEDYNVLITRAARILKPDGSLLAIYLPGVLKDAGEAAYDTLHTIRSLTDNRGLASGSARVKAGTTRTRSKPIMSSILGAMDPVGPMRFCRLTAWTGKEAEQWEGLRPLWQAVSQQFAEYVPDRYAKQIEYCQHTAPEWVIPETPFTTVTINNTYPTGVHTDSGDLEKGFSCLGVVRRGEYTGGVFVWPEYRLAVDLKDGDLVLMDAHEWHGNTRITCACGNEPEKGPCKECGAERISLVCYYRTMMYQCETANAETAKREAYAEKRAGVSAEELAEEADEAAAEAVTTTA